MILDEVGRGTSTFDGLVHCLGRPWSTLPAKNAGARTLFATHYHELSELEGRLAGVTNYRVTAKEQGEDVIFLRKVVPGRRGSQLRRGRGQAGGVAGARDFPGAADHGPAGGRTTSRRAPSARPYWTGAKTPGTGRFPWRTFKPMELVEEISALDVVSMTPIDALNKLFELNEKARRI